MATSNKNITAKDVQWTVRDLGDPERARGATRFFKTGHGQYGAGDVFLGLRAAELHRLAREFQTLATTEAEILLHSDIHEERGLALLILVRAFAKAEEAARKGIHQLYLANTKFVNNWDLVDCSAPQLVGAYLEKKGRKPLYRLAKSPSLWERRISMVATQHFIRQGDFADTLKIAELLLEDKEDLIHKAAGWMLREVSKRNAAATEEFLKKHCRDMPRTMLRYAIERFPEAKRQGYMQGTLAAEK